MEVGELFESPVSETGVALSKLNPGDVCRFHHVSFEDAIKEDLFYMLTDVVEDDRQELVNVANGVRIRRDTSHRVIKHHTRIGITSIGITNGELC